MGRVPAVLPVLAACKVQISDGADGAVRISDMGVSDTTMPLGQWGTPMKHPTASDGGLAEDDGSLRGDGLEMVFSIADAADNNLKDLYTTSRATLAGAWTPATKRSFSVTGASDETPRFSPDGLALYFASGRVGGAADRTARAREVVHALREHAPRDRRRRHRGGNHRRCAHDQYIVTR